MSIVCKQIEAFLSHCLSLVWFRRGLRAVVSVLFLAIFSAAHFVFSQEIERDADSDEFGPRLAEAYSYESSGRRDPFVIPFVRGIGIRTPTELPPGLGGLSVNELSLLGLVFSGGRHLGVVQAPDNRIYILRGDEQLFDAVVDTVSEEGVLFLQEVNDPLSLVAVREVLRTMQGQEDGR